MLKAKLDSVRKNKKGFSLVELIIVIAIMVALIAVMAPAFVKYVQKSRDAALATAAEDLEKTVQTFYGDPDCTFNCPDSASIVVKVDNKKISVTDGDTLNQTSEDSTETRTAFAAIKDAAGVDVSKAMGTTDDEYTIYITKGADGNVKVTMTKTHS